MMTFDYTDGAWDDTSRLSFDAYQAQAATTAIYPEQHRIVYPVLGLAGEAGEVSEKVKKIIRDFDGDFSDEKRHEIAQELGDMLWYVAALASDLGYDLGYIAKSNLSKLASRQKRGVLGGSGDNR